MCNTAAHLVDRVFPAVPIRHWVLSLPFELRGLAAVDARVLAALARIFADAIAVRYRASARRDGIHAAQGGAVTFVQRFGSSLNLHVHFHVAVLDGVYARDVSGSLRFYDAPPPTHAEVEALHVDGVAVLARLGRGGLRRRARDRRRRACQWSVVAMRSRCTLRAGRALGRAPHGGIVDKFMGDGMRAVFGAPEPLAHHARAAVLAAIDARAAIARVNARRAADDRRLQQT
jgi:hypothetical protein